MKNKLIIALIFIISFILYVAGINWGLPSKLRSKIILKGTTLDNALKSINRVVEKNNWQSSHQKSEISEESTFVLNIIRTYNPDEQYIIKSLATMKPSKLDFDPKFYIYPAFLIYFIGFVLKLLSIFKIIVVQSNIEYYFQHPEEIGKMYLTGRFICCCFAAGIPCFIYLITKKIYTDKKIIFFASLLTILIPLNVYWANFLLPDIPMSFFIMAAIYFSILMHEKKELKYYVITGILSGLAISTKYTAIAVFAPVIIAHILDNKKIFNKNIIILFIISGLVFICINPYLFLSWKKSIIDMLQIKNVKASGWGYNSIGIAPMFIHIFSSLLYNGLGLFYATSAAIACLISIIILIMKFVKNISLENKPFLTEIIQKQNKKEIILFSFFLISYFLLTSSKYVAYHYLVIFIPILNIIISRINFSVLKKYGYILMLLILITFSIYDYIYIKNYLISDTRMETGLWINENILQNTDIGYIKNQNIAYNSPVYSYYKYKFISVQDVDELKIKTPKYFILSAYSYRPYYKLKQKMLEKDFKLYDYLLNGKNYKIIYSTEERLKLGFIKIIKTNDVLDDMMHLCTGFLVLKKNE